ncbi:MAG: GMC family oxidoreductase N-terminal domain-containing protein [Actinomycetota bacterium]
MPEHEGVPPSQRPTERIARPGEAGPHRPPPAPSFPDVEPFDDDMLEPTQQMPTVSEPDATRATSKVEESEPLPSIEELTFARPPVDAGPRLGEPPPASGEAERDVPVVQVPAPSPPLSSPLGVPKVLSKRRFATLTAFAETLIPHGGPIPHSASETGTVERLDAATAAWDPSARKIFSRFLTALEWSSVFSRHLRGFSKLKPAARAVYLERASRSKLLARRAPIDLLKFYTLNQWASTPRVEEMIGFTYSCVSSAPPRDGDTLEVLSFPQVNRDHTEECDVVVIGSGAGGAVVAKELAELGHSVIVLEEGSYFTRKDMAGPPFERFQRFYRRQGMTAAFGNPTIPVPLGMAVGGSTLINSGSCFRTPDRVLQRWERDFGLPGIDPESMRPFFERVERIQRVQPVPEELLGENARIFRRGVQKLGLHGEPIRRNIDGCRGCGVCAFGCPSDAKLATHLSYLPRAQRAGAAIYANTRAARVIVEDGRARGVTASLLEPTTRKPMATLTVRAKVVIVAAGAIHTPAFLADNALGNLSGHLGRHLRIHPAAAVGAYFDEDVFSWRGTLQPYYVDDWHESLDVMIEVTSSVPSVGAGTFPGVGQPLKEGLGTYPKLATAGLFVSDTSSGRVIRRAGKEPAITYKMNKHDSRRMVRGLSHVAEIFLAAGARAVLTGLPGLGAVSSKSQLDDLKEEAVKPGSLRLTAFHPVGTARMGSDPAQSVVGPYGEVHGVAGLFVSDASVLPGCPTVNPQITIMAFATRTADYLARHASSYF